MKCWEPMTIRAVHETFAHLPDKHAAAAELWARYGITMQKFQVLNGVKNADLLALTRATRAPSALSYAGAPAKAGPQASIPKSSWMTPVRAHGARPAGKAQGIRPS